MITDINELLTEVRRKLPEYLADLDITNTHKHFHCLNPNHDDKNASMSMGKTQDFVLCFSCNKSADIFTLANWVEGLPLEGEDFIKKNVYVLAERFKIKFSIIGNGVERAALKYAYLRAHKLVSEFITNFPDKVYPEVYLKEIKKRKWNKELSRELGLGYAESFKSVYSMLLDNGFTKDSIELLSLARSDIFHPDNVIFTIYDKHGRPCAFYSRDTKFEEKKLAFENRDKLDVKEYKTPAKYNSTANYPNIYEKSMTPYGIHDAKNFHKIIIVEGHSCKMTLRQAGIDNVIALGGLSLNENTINELISLGVTSIVLCLDNDAKGKERLKNIVRQYYGKISLDIFVLDMACINSDVKDPDEFIRKFSPEAFRELPERNALEWLAVTELAEKGDTYTVLNDITPLIAQEKSPLARMRVINTIADMTGIDKLVISEEVDQKISLSKDRKGEFALKVIDEARELIIMNPGALGAAVNMISSKLDTLNANKNNEELFNSNETLKFLVKREEEQDSGEVAPIIKTGFSEFDEYIQLPTNEAFILVPGAANASKTTFLITLANNILDLNEDTIVIMHTIDDSRSIYFDRCVANRAGLHINWIKNPNFYLNDELKAKRKEAYRCVSDYIRDDRLIIKDVTHGNTVEYLGELIKYYRNKYPTKRIIVFEDNFHKLNTEAGYDDKRLKTEYISAICKGYTNKFDCIIFATVELGKQLMHEKPQNASAIKETAALEYDSNLILFLWNSLNSARNKDPLTFPSNVLHYNKDLDHYVLKPATKPIIEVLILKNKLSEFKSSLYFELHPELAIYKEKTRAGMEELFPDGWGDK